MIKGIFYIEAFVSDFDKSKKFYGEILGWKLHTDLPVVAGFYFGTGYLVILPDNRPTTQRHYAGGMHIEAEVEDVAAEHARLKELGVNVSELSEKPWGESKFTFTDPDGYIWTYGQPKQNDA